LETVASKQLAFYSLMYGGITFFVSLIFNTAINYFIQKDKPTWVFWKWILATLFLILCIALANYFFGLIFFDNFNFSSKALLGAMLNTLLLGIFPLVFIGSIVLIQSQQKNSKIAEALNLPVDNVVNKTIQLGEKSYSIDDILYIEAMQNYVVINDITLSKQTFRSTLSKLADELLVYNIVRCHRSYLVNINAIKSVSGNAQGLKLQLKNTEQIIPVSRKYISKIKTILV